MKLVVTAPRGKMGKLIIEIAAQREGIELVGAVAPADRDYIGRDAGEVAGCGPVGAKVYGSIEEVIDNCDCVIDFSTVEEGMHILEVCRAKGVALVCGTTGFTPEQREAFATAGADIPVMLAANTSRMVNVMSKLLAQAASALHETCDIEIVDYHDAKKLDAPSGTAKEFGETIAEAIELDLAKHAKYGRGPGRDPRGESEIGFHSLRGGDTPSSHTVYFMGSGERLEITHHSINWKCFASGAVDAGEWIVKQPKGSYVISDCIEM